MKDERILITGATGFVGGGLFLHYAERNTVFGTSRQDQSPFRQIELAYPALTRKLVEELKPSVIIHTAGAADPDFCEKNPELAYNANLWPTWSLAEAVKDRDTKLVMLSTSYVFKGIRGGYSEVDTPDPINWYGKTKLLAEKDLLKTVPNAAVLRCDLIYSEKSLGAELDDKQLRSPMLITDLAGMIDQIISQDLSGVIHGSGAEHLTKYQLGKKLGLDVVPVYTDRLAKRPKDSTLMSSFTI